MSVDNSKIAALLRQFKHACDLHDRLPENAEHSKAYGIGVSYFDLQRLGFDDGEELWPGVKIVVDGKTAGNFRVLCDGHHATDEEEDVEEPVRAVSENQMALAGFDDRRST